MVRLVRTRRTIAQFLHGRFLCIQTDWASFYRTRIAPKKNRLLNSYRKKLIRLVGDEGLEPSTR